MVLVTPGVQTVWVPSPKGRGAGELRHHVFGGHIEQINAIIARKQIAIHWKRRKEETD